MRDDEIECLQAVKRRVDHLKEYDKNSLSKMEIWRRQRYERILVDFLFRTRCFETAQALAKATGIEVCLDAIWLYTVSYFDDVSTSEIKRGYVK